MRDAQWGGLLLVFAGGICQGSFMLPMKWARNWAWENTWLIFASSAYLLCPWLLLLLTFHHVFEVYRSTSVGLLLVVLGFGIGWGVGAVMFGLGVSAVGVSLGYAVILGLAACVGTLVPILLLPAGSFSLARATVIGLSLAVMLGGVAICSFAGKWKEQSSSNSKLSYWKGLGLCVASGVLSASGNLGFVFGAPIVAKAQALGAPPYMAANVVWALITLALLICNSGYAIFLLKQNHSVANFRKKRSGLYFLYAFLMGVLWISGLVFYGFGAQKLGALGPSLGWAIFMATMVLAANLLGLATGEWIGAPPGSIRRLAEGVLLLLLAVIGLGYANWMS